ncbi:phage protease [Eikenella sp. HMSC071B05]|uniref:phage protease n=1 Tax=Eikenella sp. HMSC071B05 TaxID=1739300 RepID=UPI00143B2E32|nr:phage protease [Eikenella sp. HMSC071B05]
MPPALTNTPALDQLDPVALAAASRLLNPLQPSQKDEAMNEAQKLMLSLLGLPETASEAEQLAAMQQIQSSTDGKKLAEALAAAKEAAKPENKPAEPNPPAAPAAPAGQPANDETGAPNTAAASQQVPLSALQGLQRQVAALSQQLAAHESPFNRPLNGDKFVQKLIQFAKRRRCKSCC